MEKDFIHYSKTSFWIFIIRVYTKPLQPGDFVHTFGDAHVYTNHIVPLESQLEREPRQFPTLAFARTVEDINSFKFEDFLIEGYNPHPKIKMDMAV